MWPDLSSTEGIIAFSISTSTEEWVLLVGFLVRVLMLKAVSSGAEERCAHIRLVTHTKYHTFDFDQGKCCSLQV